MPLYTFIHIYKTQILKQEYDTHKCANRIPKIVATLVALVFFTSSISQNSDFKIKQIIGDATNNISLLCMNTLL
jgi:hypothetical protein